MHAMTARSECVMQKYYFLEKNRTFVALQCIYCFFLCLYYTRLHYERKDLPVTFSSDIIITQLHQLLAVVLLLFSVSSFSTYLSTNKDYCYYYYCFFSFVSFFSFLPSLHQQHIWRVWDFFFLRFEETWLFLFLHVFLLEFHLVRK